MTRRPLSLDQPAHGYGPRCVRDSIKNGPWRVVERPGGQPWCQPIRSALMLGRFAPRSSACVPGGRRLRALILICPRLCGRHADRAMRSIAGRVAEGPMMACTDTAGKIARRPRVFTDTPGGCSLGGPSDRWRSGDGPPVLYPCLHRVGCSLGGPSDGWRSGDGLPVLGGVPSPGGLLAGWTIRPLALRGWATRGWSRASRRSGCSLGGRSTAGSRAVRLIGRLADIRQRAT